MLYSYTQALWNIIFCIIFYYLFQLGHVTWWPLLRLPWWRHQIETFPRHWPFVWGIHQSPVNSPHKGQWCGALMFSLICVWMNDWVNNREAGDLRHHRAHYDVTVMYVFHSQTIRLFLSPRHRLPVSIQYIFRENAKLRDTICHGL